MNDGERLDDWWNGLIPSSVTDAENKAMEAQQGEATAALQSAQLTTEKLQDALSTIKVLTRERDEMEAIAERTHGDLLRVQVELDAAIKRAEAAEGRLADMRDARTIDNQESSELIIDLRRQLEAAEAALALVDTFAQWKRNAPHGSLTFEQWLAGREAAGYPTITARIGQTIIRPEFPVDPADYE